METDATNNPFDRLRTEGADAVDTRTKTLNTLRDLKIVNIHIVASAAAPVLEGSGDLLSRRIRPHDETTTIPPLSGSDH